MRLKYMRIPKSRLFLIVIILTVSMSQNIFSQCTEDIIDTCPDSDLIVPCSNDCSGPNPAFIRANLGWGINYDCASNTYQYTDSSGNPRSYGIDYGMVREIYVKVPNPDRGRREPDSIYLMKNYFYNISIKGRRNFQSKRPMGSSCWIRLKHGEGRSKYERQQKATRRGQVAHCYWRNGNPINCIGLVEGTDRTSDVADRPIFRIPLSRASVQIPILPRTDPVQYVDGLLKPCDLDASLCIQFGGGAPINVTLTAFRGGGASRVITTMAVPAGSTNVVLPYVIADNEYLRVTYTWPGGILPTGLIWSFNEYPARMSSVKAADHGDVDYLRSPDNVCLIADDDRDGVWDDFPVLGVDY